MNTIELMPSIRRALARRDFTTLNTLINDARSADIAERFAREPDDIATLFLEGLALSRRADIFAYLPRDKQYRIAQQMNDDELARLFTEMNADDSADIFNMFEPVRREAILRRMARKEREDMRRLSSYEEGTAGAIMTSDYVSIFEHLNVSQALNEVRQTAPDAETIYQVYMLDQHQRLVGTLSLRQLILADPLAKLDALMIRDVIHATTETPQEEVARMISHYDLLAIPIINDENKLVGIVTYDDAMDVVEKETTDDFHRSGSVGTLEESIGRTSLFTLYRKRVFWLVLLVFGNLFSGAGIAHFESTIEAQVALVFFLPLLIGSGGNAGSQAATLMVRGLGTGEINIRDWTRLLGRELLVSATLGLTMALAISPIGLARGGADVAYAVAISMVIIVVVGSLLGMSLPFLLDRIGFDPATASGPLVATLCDSCGVLIFFSIATAIIRMHGG
jgi:magnesium transporter